MAHKFATFLLRLAVGLCSVWAASAVEAQEGAPPPSKQPVAHVFRRTPIVHKPLTIDEFRRVKPGITPDSEVRLSNGRVMPFRAFLADVNNVEKLLNPYGYTLRVAFEKAFRSETPIPLGETLGVPSTNQAGFREQFPTMPLSAAPSGVIPSLNGPLQEFQPNTDERTFLDPSIIGLKLKREATALNKPTSVELSDSLELDAYAFGNSAPLVRLFGMATAPSGMQPNDPERRAVVMYAMLGLNPMVNQGSDTGASLAKATYTAPNVSLDRKIYNGPLPGCPIPVNIQVGFKVRGGGGLTSSVDTQTARDEVAYQGALAAYVAALLGSSALGVGLETDVDILGLDYDYSNLATMSRMPLPTSANPSPPWAWTSIEWKVSRRYSMESGSGKLQIVVKIDLWFTQVSFGWDIITWNGYQWADSWKDATQYAARPPGCGDMARDVSCVGTDGTSNCVSLSTSLENCGGCNVICPPRSSCSNGLIIPVGPPPRCRKCPPGWRCCDEDVSGCCLLCVPDKATCPVVR